MKNTLLLLFIFSALQIVGQDINPDSYKSMRASTLKSDIEHYYNPLLDKYNIHFVKLDLEVSDQSTYISGNTIIQAKVVEQLDTLIFDFCNEMTIDSVFLNEKKVDVAHTENVIVYIFETPVSVNENIKTQVYYHGTPDIYGGGVTHDYSSIWDKNMTWTLSESFHAYEWWPCKQVLSDKIDSAYIFLTCNNNCMAGSNGLLKNTVDLPNSKKRFEWKTYYPINYYLISFAVSEYQDYSIYAKPDGVDSILIQNFVYNNSNYLADNKTDIDNTIDFIELYSDKFGLYPFANEKYGHCLTTLGGGMEHQTMTTLGNFGYTLVAHELGHMWFGDYVTCASWQDIWINEGFASYTEYVALEYLKSEEDAKEWMAYFHERALLEPNGSIYIPFEDAFNENRIFSSNLSYKKGAAILHMLRHEIDNDDLFFSSLKNYLSEYGNSVATGEDFKNSIETTSGINFDFFFNQWYYGKGYPRFDVGYTQFNDTLFMTVNQTTSSVETPLFQLNVDFKVYSSNKDTTLRLYQSSNLETFKIPFHNSVTNIVVDPENWILNQQGTVDSIESPGNNKSLFSFSPNPVKESIYVNFNIKLYDKEKEIQILDLNGRLIKSFETNSNYISIDVSYLSNGLYFIKGISENKAYTYKFIKQ